MVDVDAAPPQMGPEIDLIGAVDQSAVQLPGCVDGESSIEATNNESETESGTTNMPDSMAGVDVAPPQIGLQHDLSLAMRQTDESVVASGKRPQQVLAERGVHQGLVLLRVSNPTPIQHQH